MPKQTTHPSPEELSAFSLGQLPPDAAAVVESHISECHPCCETMLGLSSDDTFVGLLQEAKQLPTDRTIDLGGLPAKPSSSLDDVPAPLAAHPRYEIVGLIGKGGMGDVYKARHRMMERTVALKIINRELVRRPEAVDRFHREVKTAAQLSHPNIVTAHDAEQAGDVHFLVMEYVDGVDLSQTVKDRGALPIAEACEYVRQAAIGLQHAHEQGMVHRDIKPHNLVVTADGTLKILDFGLASLAPEASSDADTVKARGDLTAAGAIMGTPDFISPEQANDARQADIRSDIYSLGASLYFLLSGRPLFTDGSVMHKIKSHAQAEPEALESLRDDIPAELAAVASKMIAKDPDERFQTPAEVAAALETFSRASRPAEQQSPRYQLQPRRERSRVLPFTAVAMLFVAAIVAAVVYYIQTNKGTVRVEVTDESLEVTINNQTITMKDGNKEPLEIRATEHKLIVRQRDSDFEFETDNFEVRRNREIAFKVELLDGQVVVSKGGKKFKSKALRSAEPLDFNTELGNANQIETGGRAIERVSATALVNGCEVTGGFTVEQAEIAVKNPTSEAREVSFYYQVVYQNSRDRDDIFQLRGGVFKETVAPGREAIKRVDTLPDPNASMPVNYMKDLLVMRISRERLKEFTDIPIQPTKKLDIANQPVTIASQADREGSSARIILDQGYTIIDAGTSIGSRRLVVTKKAQTLSIVEEYSLALKWEGAPLGIVERDFSADYSLAGDTPLILRGTTSTKEQGSLVMHGTVEFTSGEALTRWTSYTERGRKLETPSKQQVTVKPPSGPLVLGSTIQVVGPLLLTGDGERKIVLGNFDDHTPAGKPLVEYEAGCRLRRTTRPDGAGFTITLVKPDSEKPEMTLEYDSQGECESIQVGSTTVLKLDQTDGKQAKAKDAHSRQNENAKQDPLNARKTSDSSPINQIAELLDAWKRLPDQSAESEVFAKKISTLHNELYKQQTPNTERSRQTLARLALLSWPHLSDAIPKPMARTLAELTKPDAAVRVSDRLAEADRPTEPVGWDVQAAHALALARAGKTEEALQENQALMKKMEVNLRKGRLPEIQLEFLGTTRTQKSLLKQTLLQKSLILAIAGRTTESVDASTAAGRVEVNKPTQDDQAAIQAMLRMLAKAAVPPADDAQTPAESDASTKRKTTAFLVEAAKSGDLDAVNAALKAGVDGEDIGRQVSSAETPRSLPGAGFNGPGFRLLQDENQRVVAAHYHGEAGIDFLIRHGKAQSSDFSPPTQLHVYPHLESLTYPYGFILTTEDVGYIATLQNLKEIELGFVGVSSEYVTIEGDLSKLGRLKRLERVHLCKEEMTDQDLKFITALPRIKQLEFNANANGRGEEGPRCTDRCADYLSQATTLETVWVHDATNFTDRFVSKMTEGLANLEYFQMSSPELTDESLRLLAERCKKLNWLDIGSDRFTDEGVQHLKTATNLRKLWLRSSSLNDESVRHIKELRQLQHLELTVPAVDDDDVLVLASFRELEILALRRPALTDQQFAMFRNHPRLKSAFINGRQLSKDEVVKVIETLPNLKALQIGGNESLQRAVDQALARKQASR